MIPTIEGIHGWLVKTLIDEVLVLSPRLILLFGEKAQNEIRPQPIRGLPNGDEFSVAGPGEFFGKSDNLGANRIEMDVPGKLTGIGAGLDENRLVSALEEMSDAPMLAIKIHRIGCVHKMHDFR